jgi:CoA-transferase family III
VTQSLSGVRVLDFSRLVAGGIVGMLMADFGADVVKVEQPGVGDPLRSWTTRGEPFWWKVYARNKRLITLNLKAAEGRALLQQLVPRFDVMIESFVPGTLEGLDLGWPMLQTWHPGLVLLRISGWGQTGPDSQRPGFGTLVEAASGFAAMNGEPDGPPIVPSFPLADTAAGLYATNAVMFALYHRATHGGAGQVIDVSLFESLFSVLGPLPAEYAAFGLERWPARLLSHQRRWMDCGERIDTEDGRAISSQLWPRASARRSAFCTQRGPRGACGGTRRRDREGDWIADGCRERHDHRCQSPDVHPSTNRGSDRAPPSLAVAPTDGRRARRFVNRSHAQRRAASLGNTRSDSVGRRRVGQRQRGGVPRSGSQSRRPRRAPLGGGHMTIADCRLQIADCRLQIADCGVQIADCGVQVGGGNDK